MAGEAGTDRERLADGNHAAPGSPHDGTDATANGKARERSRTTKGNALWTSLAAFGLLAQQPRDQRDRAKCAAAAPSLTRRVGYHRRL